MLNRSLVELQAFKKYPTLNTQHLALNQYPFSRSTLFEGSIPESTRL